MIERGSDIRVPMADRFHRRSIRLRGYDYTRSGAYYITVCTHDRLPLFGDVVNRVMMPIAMGHIVQRCWDAIPEHMPMVVCDAFVVMPNHVHGIIVITGAVAGASSVDHGSSLVGGVGAANSRPLRDPGPADDPIDPPPPDGTDTPHRPPIAIMVKNSLGHIMQTFKAAVSRQALRDGLMPRGTPIWQRGYYERIIRDDGEHDRIARYIADNPANWKGDRFNR
jgi:REP element-mobilizing transposase RayT